MISSILTHNKHNIDEDKDHQKRGRRKITSIAQNNISINRNSPKSNDEIV